MYAISRNKRKYSTTPIVRVAMDENGNELSEQTVCIVTLPKKEGDVLSEQIVNLLNRELLFIDFTAEPNFHLRKH
jgi:hypothetical protein